MSRIEEGLSSPEIQSYVSEKLVELRKRLLDSTRRNPLIHARFRPTSTSNLRVIDELPDVLRFNLTNGNSMRLRPLPALEVELPDELTNEFLNALYIAREEDEDYLSQVEELESASEKAEEQLFRIERALKDKIREQLGLPPRQTKDDLSLTLHAKNHGLEPSYSLPMPQDEHEDGRHQDKDIQTLLLPDKLIRVAKGILEKGRSFERETGVNVLHAAFGLLEWKDPSEDTNFLSPLLLLEIRIERKQSASGAEFYVSGVDKVFINTTLALKLFSEHRLTIPEYETGSIEEYFEEIQNKGPQSWHWKVRREVVFGIFPSSKIAMYHDLDPKKRPIASHKLIARLLASSGGGDGAYADVYETDDPKISKKVPYLILDADASQYSALVDVADGQSLAIEGPPGSGKSQTIVNIIAAALADGKKVLFVAEKLTALDVVKNRLHATNLAEFVLPLQAGRGTREKIYESLQERLSVSRGSKRFQIDFTNRKDALEGHRSILKGYLDALGSKFGATGMTVYETIGHGIETAEILRKIPKEVRRIRILNPEELGPNSMEAIVADAEAFAERLNKIHQMPKLWLASSAPVLSRDDAEDASDTAGQLANELEAYIRDINASSLKPFVSISPFDDDIEKIDSFLKIISAEANRINPSNVETLVNSEHRQVVQRLCGQLQERRVALIRLERILRDVKGWNLLNRLLSARDFAAANGESLSALTHKNIIEEIEKQIIVEEKVVVLAKALPLVWTEKPGATLNRIRENARTLRDFPEAIKKLRRFDEARQIGKLATELIDTVRKLASELGQIQESLPNADNHDPAQIRNAARTILDAGAFRFLSSKFKHARNTYRNTLRGRLVDDRYIMANRLGTYANWLERRRNFEGDKRYISAFGDIFKGLATNLSLIDETVAFYRKTQEISNDDRDLRRAIEEGSISEIETFCALEFNLDMTLAELEVHVESQKVILTKEKDLLNEAEEHLTLFKDQTSFSLTDLEQTVDLAMQVKQLSELIETSEAGDIIGSQFAGIETNSEILQNECALAELISATPAPAQAISIMRSGTALELLRTLDEFRGRRNKIGNISEELWTLLNLPEHMRSATGLYEHLDDLKAASGNPDALLDRAQIKRAEDALRNRGFNVLVDWIIDEEVDFDTHLLGPIVRSIIAKNMADRVFELHASVLKGYDGQDFDRVRKEISAKDHELIQISRDVIRSELLANANPPVGNNLGRKSTFTNMSLIINEMNKKKNRIGVRELTHRAGEALLELKPCWMMSPLAVAQYLHEGLEFDLVVIDEASQMTPENAIGAISRARQAVVVGDTKQLPPTSFFQKVLDDGDLDEDLREDSESILDLANIAFTPIRQLRWHYRSRHPSLIQFSNQWMYKGELTIFPSAQDNNSALGVELVEVPGVYKSRRNEIEAASIVKATIQHMTNWPDQSLGICAMNSDQKDLILEAFERERDRNPKVQEFIAFWEEENDGLEEFFIKNLETIQGDERDVMFISTLYGPEKFGERVLQRFGPINSAQGHRRLNVLFTRAKRKIVTFTSMKPSDIIVDGSKNVGVQMFRAWLEYSKTGSISEPSGDRRETESPFEDFVFRQIEAMGCVAVPQVGVAGFRIDLGVRHPDWPYGYILGVECDGATYHSSKSSRDRDRLRQEVLEGLGWNLHRIWSTDWFRNPQNEIEKLREAINRHLEAAKSSVDVSSKRRAQVEPLSDIDETFSKSERSSSELTTVKKTRPSQVSLPMGPARDDLFSDRPVEEGRTKVVQGVPMGQVAPTVAVGSKVKVENLSDGGKKFAFKLVQGLNNPEEGLIGIHTPLGAALIDAQLGDEVEYQVGSYIKEVRVIEIS
ncbi:DUF4011 domain-containing protein [Sneathiella litorea]|uniref:DUF4011 domain-containing protein n=1 Tax=Sneathiella litorea TaxID=2606216 RepID=A0A6L8W3N0_9PROT|nr:DUF4011 domain-containing protein [Sneathiella litorea]MZR29618.1 DUF4011 domain-containing protein [Sneathiella litorea]